MEADLLLDGKMKEKKLKSGYYYVAKKNSRTMTDKMVVKKYDPVVRTHVEFKEGKIK